MSYDLRVATHERPRQGQVELWLTDRQSFTFERGAEEGDGQFTRLRGKKPHPSFEVSAPTPILDPEDIDEELATAAVAPRWYTEISAPYGLPDQDYAAARSFAKHIAEQCNGAAFDPQSDKLLWPPKSHKRITVPSTPERIRVVCLRWFFDAETMGDSEFPLEMLKIFKLHLIEALPRRYGEYEPPRHKFEEGGEKAFAEFCHIVREEPLNTLFWKAQAPCFGGTLSFPSRYAKPDDGRPAGYVALDLDGRLVVDGQPWLPAVTDLFTAFASRLKAFYAAAYVERGVEASRGSLWFGPGAEHISLMGPAWKGLPREPVWMSYFDSGYAAELEETLRGFETAGIDGGTLLRFGGSPMDQDEIRARFPWFPEHALAPPRKQVEIPLHFGEKVEEPGIAQKVRRLLGRE